MTYTLPPQLPPTPTPADYSRIHFDPSEVPAKRIVGLLACQRDPLLRSLTSRVYATAPAAAPPLAQKGRHLKKKGASATSTPADTPHGSGSATPVVPPGKLWEVELDDTVVFPEGGGQPWDTGRMFLRDANGAEHAFAIESCIRRKLDAVHVVRVPDDSPIAFDSLVGAEATVEVAWERRMDHMITHTAQHLLSAVLDTRGLPTLSWGMGQHPTTEAPYVELPRGLTWAEVAEVEKECNELIQKNLKVWIDVSVQQDHGTVSDPERANEVERENRSIPKDYTGGVIRHCNIDGIDRNACCGTQCPELSVIGFLHILPPPTPSTATKPTSTSSMRLFFVAGPRAVAHLADASRQLSLAGQVINVGRVDVVERIQKIDANRFETAEREKALKAELARVIGEASAQGQAATAHLARTATSTHDYDFLSAAAGAFLDAKAEAGVEGAGIVAWSAPPGVSPALLLVQSRDEVRAKALFDAVKSALAGDDKARVKGGGARGRFMAKVDGKWGKADAEAIAALVSSA